MSDKSKSMPDESIQARSAPRRRWRFDLLDLFGVTTLVAFATASVLALPDEPREDRVFLAMVFGGITLGLLLGRGIGSNGVLISVALAAIAAGAAMAMFQFSPWQVYNYRWQSAAARMWGDPPTPLLPRVAISVTGAAVVGWILAALYVSIGALIKLGPRRCVENVRRHWLRFSILFLPPLIPAAAIGWTVASAFQGAGPLAISLGAWIENCRMAVSSDGKWWAVETSRIPGLITPISGPRVWTLFRLDGNKLTKNGQLGEKVAGELCFAPRADFMIHSTMRNAAIIRSLPTGNIILFVDDALGFGEIHFFDWTDRGIVIAHHKDEKLWLELLQFDGNTVKPLQRHLVGQATEQVAAVGREFDWVAHHEVDEVDNSDHLIITRLSDGKPLRRLETFGHSVCQKTVNSDATHCSSEKQSWFPGYTTNDFTFGSRRCFQWIEYPRDTSAPTVWNPQQSYCNQVPLGSYLLKAMDCSQLTIIDPTSGREVACFKAVPGNILDAAASDDRNLVGALTEGRIYVWNMPARCR